MKIIKSIGILSSFCFLMSFTTLSEKSLVDNTVCATGTVESAEFGTITVTICYTGPETGSALAAKHREAIAKFRAEAQ